MKSVSGNILGDHVTSSYLQGSTVVDRPVDAFIILYKIITEAQKAETH